MGKHYMQNLSSEYEDSGWHIYCEYHPLMNLTNSCLSNIRLSQFWAISEQYPNLVKHLNNRLDLWGNLVLMAKYNDSQLLMVLSVLSANRKLKTSTILQLIAQTSERNSSPSGQI